MKDRYLGKPFLRLLECYVLLAIGELSSDEQEKLTAMTPKLQQVYGIGGTWDGIVASVMEFPESLPRQIESIWRNNRAKAAVNGEELIPQDFAELFVDKNFQQ